MGIRECGVANTVGAEIRKLTTPKHGFMASATQHIMACQSENNCGRGTPALGSGPLVDDRTLCFGTRFWGNRSGDAEAGLRSAGGNGRDRGSDPR